MTPTRDDATAVDGTYVRPEHRMLPAVTADTTPFWTTGERGELSIHRCRSCGRLFHPPAPACFRCRSMDVGREGILDTSTAIEIFYRAAGEHWTFRNGKAVELAVFFWDPTSVMASPGLR